MPLTIDLREKIADYLSDETTLTEFQEWFAPHAWSLVQGDPAYATATRVELLLAEYLGGDRTEREVAAQLRPLVDTYVVAESPQTLVTDASDVTIHAPVVLVNPSRPSGTPHVVVSV